MEQNRVYVTFIFIGDSGDGKPSSQFLSCPSLNYVKQIQYFPTKGYIQLKLHEEALYLFLAGIVIVSPVSSRGHVTCHADLVTNVSYLHLARLYQDHKQIIVRVIVIVETSSQCKINPTCFYSKYTENIWVFKI